MRLLHWATTRIVDRYRCSCPIHEQLLAGLVLLAQPHTLFPPQPSIQVAEAAVLVAVRVCLPVLLPQQLLRHVGMLLPLPMKIGEVGHTQYHRTTARRSTEQRGLKPVIVPLRPKRPSNLCSLGSLQVLMSGSQADGATSGDRSQPQAQFKSQSKNFF